MTAHITGSAPATLIERWQAARRPGEAIPSYEALVLGNLGRFADHAALIATQTRAPRRILWGGDHFRAWLQREDVSGLDAADLSEDVLQPLRDVVERALTLLRPAVSRCDRVSDGVVTTTELLGLPVFNRHGDPLVVLSVAGAQSRYDLVKAMFGATDQGMLALSTLRDAAGAPNDFKIVALNDGAARMFGRSIEALQWQRLTAVAPRLVETGALARLVRVIEDEARDVFELSVPRSSGRDLHLKIEAGCIGDLIALTFTDVGDLKAREESSRLLFENNPLPMWLIDRDTQRFVAVNDAAIDHYGHSRARFLAMGPAGLSPEPIAGADALWTHRRADGSPIAVSLFERALDFQGRAAVLTAVIDVTERRRAEARIAHMAHHDALTDLPNRALFHQRLGEAFARERRAGKPAVLLCLDLDRFKAVNDTFGHAAGDALLRGVAERLAHCVREEDVVARMGGDEFAILIVDCDGPNMIRIVAERIIHALGQPFRIQAHHAQAHLQGQDLQGQDLQGQDLQGQDFPSHDLQGQDLQGQDARIGVSIGAALLPRDGADPDILLSNADVALYRAKAAGRNGYRCFSSEAGAWAQGRPALIAGAA